MTADSGYLRHLYDIILSRRHASPDESYVAKLFARGRERMAQKVGEEAVETALAAVASKQQALISESADLVFHLLILWADMGVTPEDIIAEMQRREGIPGLDEKSSRRKDH